MSVYETSIYAFIQIIESGLLAAADWESLQNLNNTFANDNEALSAQVLTWLQEREQSNPELMVAYKKSKSSASKSVETDLGWAKAKSQTEPGKESNSLKELLVNTIKKNTPPPSPSPNP